ncbi:hypothetical protein BV210_14375 [Halorientalis sp. IM1011]|uniref:hypothetical protein n=1 Tax=Halorientalis sp. IM1011 TaxID=1932360 RepID=UPI00097CD30E|nr:hypothetical protein [Halorientalis sp. IM1011]AQL43816.1 hypothetical protein BV210_14375 [Halorientalis sp. IM1011]
MTDSSDIATEYRELSGRREVPPTVADTAWPDRQRVTTVDRTGERDLRLESADGVVVGFTGAPIGRYGDVAAVDEAT